MDTLDRAAANVYAEWFRCLADPTRVLILNVLALGRRPMTVGEIVDSVDVGQSTVSHHLSLLAETGFVLVERQGTSSYFRVNERCIDCFPSAAELVMGRLPTPSSDDPWACAPWLDRTAGAGSSSGRRLAAGRRRRRTRVGGGSRRPVSQVHADGRKAAGGRDA